jgi:hypothetical protein
VHRQRKWLRNKWQINFCQLIRDRLSHDVCSVSSYLQSKPTAARSGATSIPVNFEVSWKKPSDT